jgi:hypothetical protein
VVCEVVGVSTPRDRLTGHKPARRLMPEPADPRIGPVRRSASPDRSPASAGTPVSAFPSAKPSSSPRRLVGMSRTSPRG